MADATGTAHAGEGPSPKGVLAERWVHAHGCRRWFNLLRDTVSHRIIAAYRIGERPPGGPGA